MKTRILSATTALALALLLPASPAFAAASADPAGSGATTWALQPATADGVDGRISLRHTVGAGTAVDDLIAVTNFGAEAARFAVYASDGTITADGSFDLIPAGEPAVDGGSWIAVGPLEGATPRDDGGIVVDVPAQSAVLVPLRISVPADATPGDHPAGIVAELVRDDADAVQVATRVGVRVHLRVTGDLVARLEPRGIRADYTPSWNPFAPGTLTVRYGVENSGNVRLAGATTVEFGGPLGIGAGTVEAEQREVLPGEASQLEIDLPVWPLVIGWGEVTVVPAVAGADDEVELQPASASFTVWAVPWSQLLLLVLAVGLVLLVRVLRARGDARVQARIAAAVAAATAAPAAIESGADGDQDS